MLFSAYAGMFCSLCIRGEVEQTSQEGQRLAGRDCLVRVGLANFVCEFRKGKCCVGPRAEVWHKNYAAQATTSVNFQFLITLLKDLAFLPDFRRKNPVYLCNSLDLP